MSNKTIAKNTLFLYIRMLFNMGAMLYISRVVLRVLGVEDFGIYNIVMGVVILFSFFNGTMTATTQRFINVEKAANDVSRINMIFNISLLNHLFIMLIVTVLAETVGLWFLNHKLNIPTERMSAANIVYQIALLIALIEIIKVPFNAMIVAHERMAFYAWLGLSETLFKLTAIFILMQIEQYDKLISYSLLLLGVSLLVFLLYFNFTRRSFYPETRFHFHKDLSKTKEMASFSGWMLLGQTAYVASTQGLNMVINLFFGVTVNAAVGIATQVDTAIYSFVNNFQVAFNPQLVQSYAAKEEERNKKLILGTSKYSFYLIAILSAPVLYFTHPLLTFWLGDQLPQYVEPLVQTTLLCSLISAMAGSFWMTALAIGTNKIKQYNIVIAMIDLCTVPLAYFLFTLGYSPVYAFIGRFSTALFMQIYRFYFINKKIQFNRKEFVTYLCHISLIFSLLLGLVYFSNPKQTYTFFEFIGEAVLLEMVLVSVILLFGLNRAEKSFLFGYILKKVKK
ncbi:polysaccharide biosynthesis protein [Rodentibacter rarus]|uniref:Polysaccharide biosynthesis protein n=1 Tax=Rodentibacter rarus TaxID=1908260 RepID=A0A1V3INI3_9PAST|nr:oligosaccharide flippase family protein [Rodentibacter rarus]OOF42514.1 polysaccharide biosynthesis protein [Rodentibacter rarus]OOF43733.1 polysaccharide biosynthesis protein [Rodentibacter rarus]